MATQGYPNIIIVNQPAPQVGPDPTEMKCPHCNSTITTHMETRASMKTHLFFILCCVIGCICCAPCVYSTNCCMAKKHTCPQCQKFIGMYNK